MDNKRKRSGAGCNRPSDEFSVAGQSEGGVASTPSSAPRGPRYTKPKHAGKKKKRPSGGMKKQRSCCLTCGGKHAYFECDQEEPSLEAARRLALNMLGYREEARDLVYTSIILGRTADRRVVTQQSDAELVGALRTRVVAETRNPIKKLAPSEYARMTAVVKVLQAEVTAREVAKRTREDEEAARVRRLLETRQDREERERFAREKLEREVADREGRERWERYVAEREEVRRRAVLRQQQIREEDEREEERAVEQLVLDDAQSLIDQANGYAQGSK